MFRLMLEGIMFLCTVIAFVGLAISVIAMIFDQDNFAEKALKFAGVFLTGLLLAFVVYCVSLVFTGGK